MTGLSDSASALFAHYTYPEMGDLLPEGEGPTSFPSRNIRLERKGTRTWFREKELSIPEGYPLGENVCMNTTSKEHEIMTEERIFPMTSQPLMHGLAFGTLGGRTCNA